MSDSVLARVLRLSKHIPCGLAIPSSLVLRETRAVEPQCFFDQCCHVSAHGPDLPSWCTQLCTQTACVRAKPNPAEVIGVMLARVVVGNGASGTYVTSSPVSPIAPGVIAPKTTITSLNAFLPAAPWLLLP